MIPKFYLDFLNGLTPKESAELWTFHNSPPKKQKEPPITDQELLAMAVAFDVGPPAEINGFAIFEKDGLYWWKYDCGQPVEVESRYHVQVRKKPEEWFWFIDDGWSGGVGARKFGTARAAIEYFRRTRTIDDDPQNTQNTG